MSFAKRKSYASNFNISVVYIILFCLRPAIGKNAGAVLRGADFAARTLAAGGSSGAAAVFGAQFCLAGACGLGVSGAAQRLFSADGAGVLSRAPGQNGQNRFAFGRSGRGTFLPVFGTGALSGQLLGQPELYPKRTFAAESEH